MLCRPSNITRILSNMKIVSFGLRRKGWPQCNDWLVKDYHPESEGHGEPEGHGKTKDREE